MARFEHIYIFVTYLNASKIQIASKIIKSGSKLIISLCQLKSFGTFCNKILGPKEKDSQSCLETILRIFVTLS